MATYIVTTTADTSSAGELTLREAIAQTNANDGADQIVFAAGVEGLIRLTNGQLNITDELVILGNGDITISGDSLGNDETTEGGLTSVGSTGAAGLSDNSRVFFINTDEADKDLAVTLEGLTITGGVTSASGVAGRGGAVYASIETDLTIIDSTIAGNTTSGYRAYGGGVFTRGEVTVQRSELSRNITYGDGAHGGGLLSFGEATITGSTISNNLTVGDNAQGGGVFKTNSGKITISASTVELNQTDGENAYGGGVRGGEVRIIDGSVISNNQTTGVNARGGGIHATIDLEVSDSEVTGNATNADNAKGGGAHSIGAVTITDSTFSDNKTAGKYAPGGAIHADEIDIRRSEISENNTAESRSYGAGLSAQVSVKVTDSAVLNNTTKGFSARGGAIHSQGDVILTNSTISGNTSEGQFSHGGAVFATKALIAENSTITGNATIGANARAGGLYAAGTDGAGLVFANSILLGNTAVNGTFNEYQQGQNAGETATFIGGNIIGLDDGSSAKVMSGAAVTGETSAAEVFAQTTDNNGVLAGAPADNGGPVPTIAISAAATNPALDGSSTEGGVKPTDADARGIPAVRARDLGAYEAVTDADLVVTTNADVIDQTDGVTSLREAIAIANARPGEDTITFAEQDEFFIRLTEGEIEITDDLIIRGDVPVTISGDRTGNDSSLIGGFTDVKISRDTGRLIDNDRVFNSTADKLTVDAINITGGLSYDQSTGGGAIYTTGDLVVINSMIIGNTSGAVFGRGGALFAKGALDITGSTITGNATYGQFARGGAIASYGALTIESSTITGNTTAGTNANGGGVYGAKDVTVRDSIILGNANYHGASDEIFEQFGEEGEGGGDGVVTFLGANLVGENASAFDASGDDNVQNADPNLVFFATSEKFGATAGRLSTIFTTTPVVALKASPANPALDATTTTGRDAFGNARNLDLTKVDNGGFSDLGALEFQLNEDFSLAISSALSLLVSENAASALAAAPVTAAGLSDVVFSVRDGVDADKLTIDPVTGVLSFVEPPDFEAPADANNDNIYEFTVLALYEDVGKGSGAALTITVGDANDTPVASPGAASANQGRNAVGRLSAVDQDGDALTYTLATAPSNGSVNIEQDGAFLYIHDDNFSGVDRFTYLVSDGISSDAAEVLITINPGGVVDPADPGDPDNPSNPVEPFDPPSQGPTAGDDLLTGTPQADAINALAGNDTVNGLSGNDLLIGDGGNDNISGAAGDDSLRGNAGADTLKGNGGDDNIKGGGGGDNIKGGGGSDNIKGNGGGDVIRGNGGSDTIKAGGGSDTVKGGGGADTIDGGGGSDQLEGGGGADVITGRGGDDTLKGNAGADVFQFRASDRNDTILDFRQGQDRIEIISGANSFDALDIEQDGADVLIGFGAGQVRVITDNADSFDNSDFIF